HEQDDDSEVPGILRVRLRVRFHAGGPRPRLDDLKADRLATPGSRLDTDGDLRGLGAVPGPGGASVAGHRRRPLRHGGLEAGRIQAGGGEKRAPVWGWRRIFWVFP